MSKTEKQERAELLEMIEKRIDYLENEWKANQDITSAIEELKDKYHSMGDSESNSVRNHKATAWDDIANLLEELSDILDNSSIRMFPCELPAPAYKLNAPTTRYKIIQDCNENFELIEDYVIETGALLDDLHDRITDTLDNCYTTGTEMLETNGIIEDLEDEQNYVESLKENSAYADYKSFLDKLKAVTTAIETYDL